jgi:ankyrin repeat protein
MSSSQERDDLETALSQALFRLCGGGIPCPRKRRSKLEPTSVTDKPTDDKCWKDELEQYAKASISSSNGSKRPRIQTKSYEEERVAVEGKAHDYEIKITLTLFHKFKCNCCSFDINEPSYSNITEEDPSLLQSRREPMLYITSEYGLIRCISSTVALAHLLVTELTQIDCTILAGYDIRTNESGILCVVTPQRNDLLRKAGKLPCSYCSQWCKGLKGKWWHEQEEHANQQAKSGALLAQQAAWGALIVASSIHTSSLVQDTPEVHVDNIPAPTDSHSHRKDPNVIDDLFDRIRRGSLSDFIHAVHHHKMEPSQLIDKHGATLLHWAAGCGSLESVCYLVTVGKCDPNQPQKGVRSYGGRTPLHWAARNGHLDIVSYLVEECRVDIDAETMDGTTALCWAAWQSHINIMKYLVTHKCNVGKINRYSCNAVLWAAQSKSESLDCIQWLESVGCDITLINSNGHGILHKAAQRGRKNVCKWILAKKENLNLMNQISPDIGYHCPSDLAGLEGYEDLALWLSQMECKIAEDFFQTRYLNGDKPQWLCTGLSDAKPIANTVGIDSLWEPRGGIRRMSAHIVKIFCHF